MSDTDGDQKLPTPTKLSPAENLYQNKQTACKMELCDAEGSNNVQSNCEPEKDQLVHNDDMISRDYCMNQSTNNITNILNLGNEMPDKLQSEMNKSRENGKSGLKPMTSTKRKHKSKVLKKNPASVKKRKWRPLWKLTNKERAKVHKREIKRIHRDRDQLMAAGAALAPHNTSDFIIEEHEFPDLMQSLELGETKSEENYNKEFQEMYDNIHDNFYDKMTKLQLIERYIDTEDQIESLDKHLKTIKARKRLLGLPGIDDSEMTKIEVFKEEIEKLVKENNELYLLNERLKNYLFKTS